MDGLIRGKGKEFEENSQLKDREMQKLRDELSDCKKKLLVKTAEADKIKQYYE